jgi:DNA replication and repair protein RecF
VVQRADFADEIEVRFEAGKRLASINGKRATAADLMRSMPLVLFSPESLGAIKEGPEQRRQLADELVLTQAPRQAQLIHEHGKCLRARNRVLKDLASGEGDAATLELTLQSLDAIYFLLCTHLAEARILALRAVLGDFRQAMAFISGLEPGDISVDYLISDVSALSWGENEIFSALKKRHAELARQERQSGVSLIGPHKHDVKFLFHENDSRFYCSQGQQRALILCFKIAQIVYHHRVHQTYPILLLDDVLSELDAQKRSGLMRFLGGISAQILMTSTDLAWPDRFEGTGPKSDESPRNAIFTVSGGSAQREATRAKRPEAADPKLAKAPTD